MGVIEKIKEVFHGKKLTKVSRCLSYDVLRKLFKHKDISVFLAWDLSYKNQVNPHTPAIVITDQKTRTVTYHLPQWCSDEDKLKKVAVACYKTYTKQKEVDLQEINKQWVSPLITKNSYK